MIHSLRRTQTLAVSIDQAWEFFSDPDNLCRITPQWLCFKVVGEVRKPAYPGQILTYTIRPFPGLSLRWVTELTHVQPPHYFVDEQRMGPYRFWHHQHHFQETGDGLAMHDIVHYALPLGPLGDVVHALYVRKRLEHIFDYRKRALARIFGQ